MVPLLRLIPLELVKRETRESQMCNLPCYKRKKRKQRTLIDVCEHGLECGGAQDVQTGM